MTTHDIGLIDSVEFRQGNERIPVEEVWAPYDVLKPFVQQSYQERLGYIVKFGENSQIYESNPGKKTRRQVKESFANSHDGRAESVRQYLDSISRQNISAIITLNDGREKTYSVGYRTDFRTGDGETIHGSLKLPSIVNLSSDDGCYLAMRRAVTYNPTVWKARRIVGGMRNFNFDMDFYENLGTEHCAKPREKHWAFIPETYLLAALEGMYEDGTMARMTPEMRVLKVENDRLYLMRRYLHRIWDAQFRPELFIRHFSDLYSLKLLPDMDFADDGDELFYEGRGPHVVNIDPDFMVYSRLNSNNV